MEDIREQLDGEILSQIENLSTLTPGSDEHLTAVESIAKLYKLKIEESKLELDYQEKADRIEMEVNQNEAEAETKQSQFDAELEFKQSQAQSDLDARYAELEQKDRQLNEQVRDRYFRIGIEAAGIVLPLAFYAIWMKKGFKFEETGTFTSTTFRGLFNRFRPTK